MAQSDNATEPYVEARRALEVGLAGWLGLPPGAEREALLLRWPAAEVGLYLIATSQHSSTTSHQVSYHKYPVAVFSKVAMGFITRRRGRRGRCAGWWGGSASTCWTLTSGTPRRSPTSIRSQPPATRQPPNACSEESGRVMRAGGR